MTATKEEASAVEQDDEESMASKRRKVSPTGHDIPDEILEEPSSFNIAHDWHDSPQSSPAKARHIDTSPVKPRQCRPSLVPDCSDPQRSARYEVEYDCAICGERLPTVEQARHAALCTDSLSVLLTEEDWT